MSEERSHDEPAPRTTTAARSFVQLDADPAASSRAKPSSWRRVPRRACCVAVAFITLVAVVGGVALIARGDDELDDGYRPGGWSADEDDDDEDNPVVRLKNELHRLTADEAKQRFGEYTARGPAPPHQSKIDHFVVLYMENHAADHFFGCMDLPGFDGIRGHKIPKGGGESIEVTCGDADYVCTSGASYDTFASKFARDGNPHTYPYSAQSDDHSALHGISKTGQTAVKMFSPCLLYTSPSPRDS